MKTEDRPASRPSFEKTKYDDSFVSQHSRDKKNEIEEQIDEPNNETVEENQDWARIEKILFRIRDLVS